MRRVSDRLILAVLVVGGYLAVLLIGVVEEPAPSSLKLIEDAMLVMGPIVGMIAQSLLRDRPPGEGEKHE